MASSFSIHPARLSSTSETVLRDEIRAHTESDEEAASILRSIARLGTDSTVARYEMTPSKARRYAHNHQITWSVRAVRP